MKKNKIAKVKLNEELAKKLVYVCQKEGISIQNQLNSMIRQKIAYFERLKVNIPRRAIDIISTDELENEEE